MSTREQYFEQIARSASVFLRDAYKKIYGFVDDEPTAKQKAADKVMFDLCISPEIYEALMHSDCGDPYVMYTKEQEPLHIYRVDVEGTFGGCFEVKAKSEDEAEEYVANNMECGECSMRIDDVDDMVVNDFCASDWDYQSEVTNVEDTGEDADE